MNRDAAALHVLLGTETFRKVREGDDETNE